MDLRQENTNHQTVSQVQQAEKNKPTQRFEVLQTLGDCYTSVGRYREAGSCYEKAANLEPDEAGPYVGLGVVALHQNQLKDAEISFRVACRLDTNCAKAYAGLAMVAQNKQEYKQAFDLYLKSLELDSENITALLGLFQTSCQMGSFEKVTYYLEVYLNSHPGDISVMFSLAALYMKDGRLEKSCETLRDILALEPENTDAANLLEEAEHNLALKETQKDRA